MNICVQIYHNYDCTDLVNDVVEKKTFLDELSSFVLSNAQWVSLELFVVR